MRRVALLGALAAVGVALAWPSPPVTLPSASNGPTRLADAWPSARVQSLASALPDGSSYQPMVVLDGGRSVGITTNADATTTRLVVWTGQGIPRDLRVLTGSDRPTIAAAAVADGQLFWLEAGDDDTGGRRTTVWRAALADGPARRIAADPSDVLYFDSGYDLQVVDDRLYWAADAPNGHGEIRSVPVDGGPVSVRDLDRPYALTTWPWATTSGSSEPGDVTLLNLTTGEIRTVTGGPDQVLTCTPAWCRVTTLVDKGLNLSFDIERADGTQRRHLGDTALTPLNTDVALLDRFEVLASSGSANSTGFVQRLWLHDLANDRDVLLADAATGTIGSRNGILWWSTGDNETTVWHILNLRDLP